MANVMWVIFGVAVGGSVVWLVAWAKNAKNAERLRNAESQAATAANDLRAERQMSAGLRTEAERAKAVLESERESFREKMAVLENAEKQFKETFAALASKALQQNNEDFLHLAKMKLEAQQSEVTSELGKKQQAMESLVNPLAETLAKLQKEVNEVSGGQKDLRSETSRLVTALRTPIHRGRWGEVQLKRVVELAGMLENCDFHEQLSFENDEGARQRPDMTINLPNGRQVVVDSKVSLSAYLDAMGMEDETLRAAKLKEHAAQVKAHLNRLSSKAYWSQLPSTPEFVVAFLPGEVFFSAALQHDPGLIEFGAEQRVILATPTTLIALLKAVAYGWRQERLTENAVEIQALGRQLHERLWKLVEHLDKLRERIDGSVRAFDATVGTLNNVLVPARKFHELGAAAGDEILSIDTVEKTPRELPQRKEPATQLTLKKIAAAAGDSSEE